MVRKILLHNGVSEEELETVSAYVVRRLQSIYRWLYKEASSLLEKYVF